MKLASVLSSLVVVLFALSPIAANSCFPPSLQSPDDPHTSPELVTGIGAIRNTLLESPCLTELLALDESVLCHPASPYVEIRFNLLDIPVTGTSIFEVSVHEEWIGNVWMETTGTLLVHQSLVGDTIKVSQYGVQDCSREFVVPACTEQVCPLDNVREAPAVDCEGEMVHYRLVLRHQSPINIPSTDFGVYDEAGAFITIMSVWEGDSIVNLFVPASPVDRAYSLCDLFQYPVCCIDFTLPAVRCDSLPVQTVVLDLPGILLYPNPVSDQLHIDVADDMALGGAYTYRIIQASGGIVSSGLIDRQPVSLDMTALPAGIYMLGVWKGDVPLGYRRVVKVW